MMERDSGVALVIRDEYNSSCRCLSSITITSTASLSTSTSCGRLTTLPVGLGLEVAERVAQKYLSRIRERSAAAGGRVRVADAAQAPTLDIDSQVIARRFRRCAPLLPPSRAERLRRSATSPRLGRGFCGNNQRNTSPELGRGRPQADG